MNDSVYQQKVTAHDGTKLKAVREQPAQISACAGCYFEGKMCTDLREHLGGKRTWSELNPIEQHQMVQAINIILGVCSQ